jgi:hypothetical protein
MSENKTSHLETVQDKRSISDGLVLKPTISYVSNDLLNREQLISAPKEEPNTQVFSHWRIMGQAHNCFPVFFLYH